MSKNSSLEGPAKGECYYKRSKKQTKQEESLALRKKLRLRKEHVVQGGQKERTQIQIEL